MKMNKSIYLFLGVAVFGASIAVFLQTSGILSNNSASPLPITNKDAQSEGQQIESPQQYASLPPASKSNSTPNSDAPNGTRSSSSNSKWPMWPSASSAPTPAAANIVPQTRTPEPPTAQQTVQYNSMQNSLRGAAHNHSATLADMVQQSKELTPEQSQKLADDAIEMIKRGELKVEQFASQPGS